MADEAGAEYPKQLHKGSVDPNGYDHSGDIVTVANADEEAAARKDGYATLHEAAAASSAKKAKADA